MPEPCEPPSLDRCQKWFLWTHQEVDLAPIPVVGLVLQVRDAKKFLQVLGFENLDRFLRVNKHGPCLMCTAIEEDGGNKRAVIVTKLMALVSSSMIQHGNISRVSPMTLCCVVAFPCLNVVGAYMKIPAFTCANKSRIRHYMVNILHPPSLLLLKTCTTYSTLFQYAEISSARML